MEKTREFVRYFIIPGYNHGYAASEQAVHVIGASDGTIGEWAASSVSVVYNGIFNALIDWVENSKEPDRLMATGFNETDPLTLGGKMESGIRFQRPIYMYPDEAKYTSGDPANPASFEKAEYSHKPAEPRAERYLDYSYIKE